MQIKSLKGRLTKKAIVITTKSGSKMAFFSIAENHYKKLVDADGGITYDKQPTIYYRCHAIGSIAEAMEHAVVGQVITLSKGFTSEQPAKGKYAAYTANVFTDKSSSTVELGDLPKAKGPSADSATAPEAAVLESAEAEAKPTKRRGRPRKSALKKEAA